MFAYKGIQLGFVFLMMKVIPESPFSSYHFAMSRCGINPLLRLLSKTYSLLVLLLGEEGNWESIVRYEHPVVSVEDFVVFSG